jgi:ERCC4-type nuclease
MALTAVFVDTREPEWVQSLTWGGATKAAALLDHGDVWASTDDNALICVERKTADDLLASIADDRLWPQLAGMRERSPWSYLVICGTLAASATGTVITERGETGWNWASLQGTLIQAQELGIVVVMVPSDAEFEATVLRLCNREHRLDMVLKPQRKPTFLGVGETLLSSLPGIGMERAQALIKTIGCPVWALIHLADDRKRHKSAEVYGIGEGTKRKVRDALGLQPGQRLGMVDSEGRYVDPWDNIAEVEKTA